VPALSVSYPTGNRYKSPFIPAAHFALLIIALLIKKVYDMLFFIPILKV
jgi:hypothetical protein